MMHCKIWTSETNMILKVRNPGTSWVAKTDRITYLARDQQEHPGWTCYAGFRILDTELLFLTYQEEYTFVADKFFLEHLGTRTKDESSNERLCIKMRNWGNPLAGEGEQITILVNTEVYICDSSGKPTGTFYFDSGCGG